MSFEKNLSMLTLALDLLGELADEVVFVGGATTCLYVDPEIADEIRPTEDVDCAIEISSLKEYNEFEKKLRLKGFGNDTTKGAPICRFKYKDLLILDVMPNDEKILGFTNSWYKEGIKHKETKRIGNKTISIFSLPYFLSSKFEAFEGRGKQEPRMSWDLEDIVLVIDGIKEFDLKINNQLLKSYLSRMCDLCLTEHNVVEAISSFLNNKSEKIKKINGRIASIGKS